MTAIDTGDTDAKKKNREKKKEKGGKGEGESAGKAYNARIHRPPAISTDHFSAKRISKSGET